MRRDLEAQGHAFEPFTTHDVRRSARTRFSSLGIPEHIGERLLAHAVPELQGRYNLYGYEAEKRAALEKWHAALDHIVNPKPSSNVIPMRA